MQNNPRSDFRTVSFDPTTANTRVRAMAKMRKRQVAMAAFDSWTPIKEILDILASRGLVQSSLGVLTSHEAPSKASDGGSVRAMPPGPPRELLERLQLKPLSLQPQLQCSIGPLAAALEEASTQGVTKLVDALGAWLTPRHAEGCEHHLHCGRILLWLDITEPETYGEICGVLVRTSPHIVEICETTW